MRALILLVAGTLLFAGNTAHAQEKQSFPLESIALDSRSELHPVLAGGISASPFLRTSYSASSGPAYTTRDLFGAWGDYNVVFINGRKIAVTLRTRKNSPNSSMGLYEEIGIYDISNPNDIHGRRFPLYSRDGSDPFLLNDDNPDGWRYVLDFVDSIEQSGEYDTVVGLRGAEPDRPGNTPEYGFGNTEITLHNLYRQRAQKIRDLADIVWINGEKFYQSAESAEKHSLLFWSADVLENIDAYQGNKAHDLRPELMAFLESPTSSDFRIFLGDVRGQKYDLRWNGAINQWDIVPSYD
ncbi:MAG: hypothetical protein WCU88_05310 [Elusimicrobiota bacterium]|jgi:hypothetical protein